MGNKYRLVQTSKTIDGKPLYRIQALKNFSNVKNGDLGGYVQGYHNLSQKGNCWIYDKGMVINDAIVKDNAIVQWQAVVQDEAIIKDNAQIKWYAVVSDKARVYKNAVIEDYARVFGNARVCGNACIQGHSLILDNALINDSVEIMGNVIVCKDAYISNHACLKGDVVIKNSDDFIVFKDTWSSMRYFTYIRSSQMWLVECFYGTSKELIKKAYKDSELSGKMYSLYVELVEKMEKVRGEVNVKSI